MITVVVLHAAEICNDTELRGAYVAKPRAHQVKKSECEPVIRHLLHKCRTDSGLDDVPEADLSFSQFYSWMEQNDSSFLAFRTATSVRFVVEMWFDQEFKLTWRR